MFRLNSRNVDTALNRNWIYTSVQAPTGSQFTSTSVKASDIHGATDKSAWSHDTTIT